MSSQRLTQLIEFFANKSIKVPKQWLSNQIEGNQLNPNDVYREWLNSDMRGIGVDVGQHVGQLPADINTIKTDPEKQTAVKTTIFGRYALQINSICDISKPKVMCLTDTIENEENIFSENTDSSGEEGNKNMFKKRRQKPKKESTKRGPRMLSMELTDGLIECKAIEYKPIDVLSVITPIGTKIIINGPFDVYGGVVFLTAKHVSVLGGQVKTLTQSN